MVPFFLRKGSGRQTGEPLTVEWRRSSRPRPARPHSWINLYLTDVVPSGNLYRLRNPKHSYVSTNCLVSKAHEILTLDIVYFLSTLLRIIEIIIIHTTLIQLTSPISVYMNIWYVIQDTQKVRQLFKLNCKMHRMTIFHAVSLLASSSIEKWIIYFCNYQRRSMQFEWKLKSSQCLQYTYRVQLILVSYSQRLI